MRWRVESGARGRRGRQGPGPWVDDIEYWNGQIPFVRLECQPGKEGEDGVFITGCPVRAPGRDEVEDASNARFIAAARQDIPDILAYVRQLQAEKEELAARAYDLERRLIALGGDPRRRE